MAGAGGHPGQPEPAKQCDLVGTQWSIVWEPGSHESVYLSALSNHNLSLISDPGDGASCYFLKRSLISLPRPRVWISLVKQILNPYGLYPTKNTRGPADYYPLLMVPLADISLETGQPLDRNLGPHHPSILPPCHLPPW